MLADSAFTELLCVKLVFKLTLYWPYVLPFEARGSGPGNKESPCICELYIVNTTSCFNRRILSLLGLIRWCLGLTRQRSPSVRCCVSQRWRSSLYLYIVDMIWNCVVQWPTCVAAWTNACWTVEPMHCACVCIYYATRSFLSRSN